MPPDDLAADLAAFIEAAPSPFHAAEEAARRLQAAGMTRHLESERWAEASSGLVVRGGSLVAWSLPDGWTPERGARLVGAHTDSPNLRVKPQPDTGAVGYRQLGVEVYGGALLNSWLDRDLGLSGRVLIRGSEGPEGRLWRIDRPLLRIPQLAIHLDRDVTERGLVLNRQQHLTPVWGLGSVAEGDFCGFLAAELDARPSDVLAWDAMCHDLTPPTRLGRHGELLSAPRIDNLASCHAAVRALEERLRRRDHHRLLVICLYDHEEVGSVSAQGADGVFLASVLERVVASAGGGREDLLRAMAGAVCVSADGAHATHPNYVERHEPGHRVALNGGPVLKMNANQRYATDAAGAADFQLACEAAGVPMQRFVTRSDLPCGSTIGPVTAARLGVRTVDAGLPQLSMHSARELCGAEDPAMLTAALGAFLADATT